MESATGHPLQALADAITIEEFKPKHRPKVVLTWAPHPKALPQAVVLCRNDALQKIWIL
jgi:N-succinyl-L-ornithine transcarbamylase